MVLFLCVFRDPAVNIPVGPVEGQGCDGYVAVVVGVGVQGVIVAVCPDWFAGGAVKIVSDGNIYWSPLKHHTVGGVIRDNRAKVLFRSTTLEEWQKETGWDKTSRHVDPQFMDYEKGDFRLKPGSPAKGKGATL